MDSLGISSSQTHEHKNGFSRRELFLGFGLTMALSACSTAKSSVPSSLSVDEILAQKPFYIAHRGSGDNWTEHTAQAYGESVKSGIKALEISVQVTSDGVMVCHHDISTLRLTGVNKVISQTPYAEIAALRNNARQWLGPGAPLLPIPRLQDVLDLYAGTLLIFIEDKTGKNFDAITKLLKSYPKATEHFVWKVLASSGSFKQAKALGFKTWGYFPPSLFGSFSKYAKNFDYLGIYFTATDQQVRELVAFNKPVVCWEIHNRSTRDRMESLGVSIMMCSNIKYVMSEDALASSDSFSSGLRAAGDLPSVLDAGWQTQPTIQTAKASIRMSNASTSSYIMGSLAPNIRPNYTLKFSMRWPDSIPKENRHAGIAFGQESDAVYLVQTPSTVGGYHLILRGTGEIALYSRAPGQSAGKKLATISTAPPSPGQWVSIQLIVDPSGITFARLDAPGKTGAVSDNSYRGGYLSLCKNYGGDADVEFKAVSIS